MCGLLVSDVTVFINPARYIYICIDEYMLYIYIYIYIVHRSESKEESFIAHHFGRVAKEGRSRIYIGTKCKYVRGTFDSI